MPISFDQIDDAIDLDNNSDFGLAASIWDSDVRHAFQLAERIQTGTMFVNVHRVGAWDVSMEFDGVKQSGFGRGHGWAAVEEASQTKIMAQRVAMSTYR